MWARIVEMMLGCWMLLSPFIFRHPAESTAWWVNDLSVGTATVLLALFSFWQFRWWRWISHAHLGILAVALWMIGFAYLSTAYPPAPALQNNFLVGLLLLMMALVPNQAELPPVQWRELISRELPERK